MQLKGDYIHMLDFLKKGRELDESNGTFAKEHNEFHDNINEIRNVLADEDHRESIKQILLGLFNIGKEQEETVVDIYMEVVTKGKIPMRDSSYFEFIDSHKIDLKQIYDVRTGILNITCEDETSSYEHCYIAPTYLGYKILGSVCKYLNVIYKEFEERNPIGSLLIPDFSSGEAKFLLVYPEILGCYTFPSWYFRTGNPENYGELIDKVIDIIFQGNKNKFGEYEGLDPKIDCILPIHLDSMKTVYLYEINLPLDIQNLIRLSPRLLDLSLAWCRSYCYASIDEMLKPGWSPHPEEHIFCGDKVKVFAMLRKLQTDFCDNRNDDPDVIYETIKKRIGDFMKLGIKVKHLKYVLDHENNYADIIPYVKRYFEKDHR